MHEGSETLRKQDAALHEGSETLRKQDAALHEGSETLRKQDAALHEGSETLRKQGAALHLLSVTIHGKDEARHHSVLILSTGLRLATEKVCQTTERTATDKEMSMASTSTHQGKSMR